MWCLRKLEKIIWSDRVRKEEVLQNVKGDGNILHSEGRLPGLHMLYIGSAF